MGPFAAFEDGPVLAQAIVDTVREPLLVLDKDLRVVAARRSFYETFQADRQETQGQLLYTLGDGQWDIPALRKLLEKTVPDESILEGYEVEHEFPKIGRRTMLLNARTVISEKSAHTAGLGTSIVQALAKELDARVDFLSDKHGTTVSIKHASAIPTPRSGD